MSDLGYITLDSQQLREAEAYTRREQDLRETGIVPHSKRIVLSYPAERAEFWERVEQRAKDRRPVLRRVV
jgi:hypothetical protein